MIFFKLWKLRYENVDFTLYAAVSNSRYLIIFLVQNCLGRLNEEGERMRRRINCKAVEVAKIVIKLSWNKQ